MVKHLNERKEVVAQFIRKYGRGFLKAQVGFLDTRAFERRYVESHEQNHRYFCVVIRIEEAAKEGTPLLITKELRRSCATTESVLNAVDERLTREF